jgi:hemerythrin-like domain-containing protein
MNDATRAPGRRELLRGAALGAPLVLLGAARAAGAAPKPDDKPVSPTEDLMREHGVLRRILLVYGEAIRRIDGNQPLPPQPIAHAAEIIRAFVEDYHERDEEEHIFPRFVKAGKLTDLVAVLLAQHQAGRKLTAEIQRRATAAAMAGAVARKEMAQAMRQFVRMYEPHSAREDTVLFPAFATLVSEREMKKLQELFEKKEAALPLGDFNTMVSAVTQIEQALEIYDLSQFTAPTRP